MPIDKDGQVWPHTDLDLNTSANLPMANIKVGMDFDTLSPATSAALTSGFQTDTQEDPNDSKDGEWIGSSQPMKSSVNDPRGYPCSGFVRDEAYHTVPNAALQP